MPESQLSVLPPLHVRVVRFFEARPWLGDVLFKVLPLLALAWLFWPASTPIFGLFGTSVHWPWMFLLELMAVVPLAFSRIRTGLAAGVTAAACLMQILTMQGAGVSAIAVPLMVYACAKYGSRSVSRIYLLIALAGAGLLGLHMLVLNWTRFGYGNITTDLGFLVILTALITGFSAAVVTVAWLLGDLSGRRRRELEAIAEKNRLLERERDHEARLAADAERMRIAREMHDVVSHSMSVMIAQADGGRYVIEQNPERAAQAFETIGETGREALTEMRRMLGVLREEQEALSTRPAPGIADLPALAEDVRASGLEVHLNIAEDSIPPLSDGVELALYRITQEALTNTLKHAGTQATSEVWLGTDVDVGELVLEIHDTGRGASAAYDGAGSGLLGMRERAGLYGGRVVAGPESGGFAVLARFPLRRVRADQNLQDPGETRASQRPGNPSPGQVPVGQ